MGSPRPQVRILLRPLAGDRRRAGVAQRPERHRAPRPSTGCVRCVFGDAPSRSRSPRDTGAGGQRGSLPTNPPRVPRVATEGKARSPSVAGSTPAPACTAASRRGRVVQPDRTSPWQGEDSGFESRRVHSRRETAVRVKSPQEQQVRRATTAGERKPTAGCAAVAHSQMASTILNGWPLRVHISQQDGLAPPQACARRGHSGADPDESTWVVADTDVCP